MNTDFGIVLAIGIPAVLIGISLVILMVHRELGPFAGLSAPGKWALSIAFGMGLLAFSFKMTVMAAVSGLPETVLDPILAYEDRQTVKPVELNGIPQLPSHREPYVWAALPSVAPSPSNNPQTPAKVELGRRLFFEKRLSADGTLACYSCHGLENHAGADGRSTASGIQQQIGPRNVPTVWNAAFQSVLFWDGRAPSLEEQAKGPILNPIEMGLPSGAEAVRRLSADPTYPPAFADAFGTGATITFDRIAQAIAAYERTLITPDTPYDRFVRGDQKALTPAQRRGMALFESVGCVLCHRGPNFSDASLLGGVSAWRRFPANPTPYTHRYPLLNEQGQAGIYRIPSLRNVALTGPWLHNGSIHSLEEMVRIMASAQLARTGQQTFWVNPEGTLQSVNRTPLTDREVQDIVAFLKALSSDRLQAAQTARAPRGG